MNVKVDLAKQSGVWDTIGYPSEIEKLIDLAMKYERDRCLSQIDREKGIWQVHTASRAVRTACENIKAMIRGERK